MPDEIDDMKTPEENGQGEHTGKVLLLAKTAVHAEMATFKKLQVWGTLVLAIAGAGFSAAMFFNRYATADELGKLSGKNDETRQLLQAHIVNETQQIAEVKQQNAELKILTKRSHEDFHYMRDQMREVAKVTHGARLVPIPEHTAPNGDDR